jgi:hypothetical protein
MASPVEAERYIRFQLEHLTSNNDHHAFEQICYRIAKRRLSSNIALATGPVGAGGDQGRDAESYYTRLPEELPGARGFVGRATSEPLVVACSVQRDGIEAKIRSDLESICTRGEPVERIAFFSVMDVPVAVQHRLQSQARERHGVALEVFDGQKVSHLLAESDLVWVAERYLDLPSHLVPDSPDEPQPDWYRSTLTALRDRHTTRLTPGAFSEVRDGLRHATFDKDARVDLPEWLGYMREFTADRVDNELVVRARYELAVATLRGLGTLQGVEGDIRAVLLHAGMAESASLLSDASVLLMYWGGAWLRGLASVSAEDLREQNIALRGRVNELLADTDAATYPNRAARLREVAAHLCLHPRWPDVDRDQVQPVISPQDVTSLRRVLEDEGEHFAVDPDVPVDGAEALEHLEQLVDLLPRARMLAVETVSETFQLFAPALATDPRYPKVRDALDAAVAAVDGDSAVAQRCRARAMAFRRAGQLLDALSELHEAKINWWHGDTLRGSLLAIRLIGQIYAELRLPHAAKQYALTAAAIAMTSDGPNLEDIVPEALIEAMDYSYVAGAWVDALALAHAAIIAHGALAADAFDHDVHPSLQQIDFNSVTALLAAERFRPDVLPVLRQALGETGYEKDLTELVDMARPSFTFTEEEFVAQADQQLSGRAFTDLGPRRTIAFAALGTSWRVTCLNDRRSVLAAERFAAAAQILLVELAPGDPVFLPQEVWVEVIAGTPFGDQGSVRLKPDNDRVRCTVVLAPYTENTDAEQFNLEIASALVYLLARLSARPESEFMRTVEEAFKVGLLHKLHVGRPYDDVAGLLDEAHYKAAATANIAPLSGDYAPLAAPEIAFPKSPGPGYDRDASLEDIRENYAYLPTLVTHTLTRALGDPVTVAGLRALREERWLDWHILLAIVNVVVNVRARSAGLLQLGASEAELRALAKAPESAESPPIPLAALTPESLRQAMQLAVLSVAKRRWGLLSSTQTPNPTAFQALLAARYGLGDDVPHHDLLADALASDGTLRPLVDK